MTRVVSARTALARARVRVLVRGALLTAVAGVLAPAFADAQMADTRPALTMRAAVPAFAPAFANSLAIAQPGPRAESDGLTYDFTLSWAPRAGATAYRVFMWTDAARTWYRIAQTTGTTTDTHAFKSGCTAFMVIAFADANAPGGSMTGLEASNVLRFPLSQQPSVCPIQHP